MPYEIETKDGIVLSNIPDDMPRDDPRLKQFVAQERLARRNRSPEFKAKVEAQQEQDRATYDPTEGMGTLDKIRANLGAGFASAKQGAQQLGSMVGLAKPVSDQDVLEKRAIDRRLAQSTETGAGADWMPSGGSALQFAGEMAPSLAIPGGAATGLAERVVPRVLQRALAKPVTAGAIGGAASGALMPVTSDESRGLNTGLGAVAGTVLPAALKAYRAARRAFTQAGAREGAGELAGFTHESPMPADPAALRTPGAENVPLSTAATYGDQELAGKELAARAQGRPGWAELDRAQRQAAWENVQAGTQRAGTESGERAARQAGWAKDAAEAMQGLDPKVWEGGKAKLRADIDVALRSPEGQNQMRPVLNEIARQMDELGPEFSPMHLAQIRSRMSGSVRGSPTDPFASAPVADPMFRSLRDEFDNVLNASTGDRWGNVIEGYKRRSVPVAQAKAETNVQRNFMTPEGTPRVSTVEDIPLVTESGLRRAITGPEAKNKYGTAPTFEPESGRVLKGTMAALERQNLVQQAKRTATGGGGSMTTPLAEAVKRLDPTQASDWLLRAAQIAGNLGKENAMREFNHALIDPQRYYQIAAETIAAGKPLSEAQQMAIQMMSTSAGGAVPRGLQTTQQPPQPQQQPRY